MKTKKSLALFLATLPMLIAPSAMAKLLATDLRDTDLIAIHPDTQIAQRYQALNLSRGILAYESHLLANLGELRVELYSKELEEDNNSSKESKTDNSDKDPVGIPEKSLQKHIGLLFSRKPEGFLRGTGQTKPSPYLNSRILGKTLGYYFSGKHWIKKKNSSKISEEQNKLFSEIFLSDNEFLDKLGAEQNVYCHSRKNKKYYDSMENIFVKEVKDKSFCEPLQQKDNKSSGSILIKESRYKFDWKKSKLDPQRLHTYFNKKFLRNIRSFFNIFVALEEHPKLDLLVVKELMSLVWLVSDSRQDVWDYYIALGDAMNVKLIDKKTNRQEWLSLAWDENMLKKYQENPEAVIPAVKRSMNKNNRLKGQDDDVATLSLLVAAKLLGKCGQLKLYQQSWVTLEDIKYPDCGSISYLNFLRILTFKSLPKPHFDNAVLSKLGASKKLKNYFDKYPTPDSMDNSKGQFRIDWGRIVSFHHPKVAYNRDDKYEVNIGAENMLALVNATLFPRNSVSGWKELQQRIEEVNPEFEMSYNLKDSNYGTITFSTNKSVEKFEWNFTSNHFEVKRIIDNPGADIWNVLDKLNIEEELNKALLDWNSIDSSIELAWLEYASLFEDSDKLKVLYQSMAEKTKNNRWLFLVPLETGSHINAMLETLYKKNPSKVNALLLESLVKKASADRDWMNRVCINALNMATDEVFDRKMSTEKLKIAEENKAKNKVLEICTRLSDSVRVDGREKSGFTNTVFSVSPGNIKSATEGLEKNATDITEVYLTGVLLYPEHGEKIFETLLEKNFNELTSLSIKDPGFSVKHAKKMAEKIKNTPASKLGNVDMGKSGMSVESVTILLQAIGNNAKELKLQGSIAVTLNFDMMHEPVLKGNPSPDYFHFIYCDC